jgi:uracil-DNA glycosylase
VSRRELAETAAQLAGYLRYQKALGVKGVVLPENADKLLQTASAPHPVASALEEGTPDLEALASRTVNCTDCGLSAGRTKVVFGEGDPQAQIMFIGEGPGRDEDLSGRPFVGRAGKLLTDIIIAMGLTREQVYIANVVKCRPPDNRAPKAEETEACRKWLDAQIEAIKPRAIVTLGNSATQTLLGIKTPISKARGIFHDYNGVEVMPTFHPSYLLRNYTKDARGKVWADVKLVLKKLGKSPPKG